MAMLKIRDSNGFVHEIVSLKGDDGGNSPHTHLANEVICENGTLDVVLGEIAVNVTLATDKAEGASNDVMDIGASLESLGSTVTNISARAETADLKADEALEYALDNKSKLSAVETLTDELNAGFVRLGDEVIPGIHEQMGDIDTALDSIINIQNALIGGDGE